MIADSQGPGDETNNDVFNRILDVILTKRLFVKHLENSVEEQFSTLSSYCRLIKAVKYSEAWEKP